jgi:hypothetical protein
VKFLIREEVPEAGLPPGQWAGGLPTSGRDASRPGSGREVPGYDFCYIFLKFIFHKLFEIQTFFKYKIYSQYSYVCI